MLELKCENNQGRTYCNTTFNRTMLELKFWSGMLRFLNRLTFNRTMLELKSDMTAFEKISLFILLIAPCWN